MAIILEVNESEIDLMKKSFRFRELNIANWGLDVFVMEKLGTSFYELRVTSDFEIEECKIREALLNALIEKI